MKIWKKSGRKKLKNRQSWKKELAAAAAIWLLTLGKNRGLVPRHQNWCQQLPKTDESYTGWIKHRFMTTFLSYKNSIFWLFQNLILWWKIDFWAWKWVPGHARTIPDHEKPGKRAENPEKPANSKKFGVGGRREAPSISGNFGIKPGTGNRVRLTGNRLEPEPAWTGTGLNRNRSLEAKVCSKWKFLTK